jgi:hypothetical protein
MRYADRYHTGASRNELSLPSFSDYTPNVLLVFYYEATK